MKQKKDDRDEKKIYEPPKVLATYEKEDLEEAIKPYGQIQSGGGGCGCGGGSILIN